MKITDEMIEAGAKEIRDIEDSLYETPRWDDLSSVERDGYLRMSREILEAALAVAPEPVDHSELIAEAREACADRGFNGTYEAGLIRRLADALEGVAK